MPCLRQVADPGSRARGQITVDQPEFGRLGSRFACASGRLLPLWGTRDRKTRVLFWSLVALSAGAAVVVDGAIFREFVGNVADDINGLLLFWSWSKFIHVISPAALIYDPRALYSFEHGVVSAHAKNLPFAYPPSLLLLIWPLALLPPVVALLLWLSVSLALYSWACWHRTWGPTIAMVGLVIPSTLAAMFYGQVSLLVAACMIGGCRLVSRRPILAGALFGLAAVKPQLGLLIPIALVSARQWRVVASAAATVALTTVASGWVFGWDSWLRLPSALVGLSMHVALSPRLAHFAPTVTAGLHLLGVGPTLTNAAQMVVTVCTVVAIWLCFRRGFAALPVAALMVGAFLVTPYAVYYDLPLVSYAVLSVVIDRHQSHELFGTGELLVLIAAVALPVLIAYNALTAPWGMMVLPLLFGLILGRIAVARRAEVQRSA